MTSPRNTGTVAGTKCELERSYPHAAHPVCHRQRRPKDKPYKPGGLAADCTFSSGLTAASCGALRYRFQRQEEHACPWTSSLPSRLRAQGRKREEARSLLASGMNPSVKRKLDKIAAATAARNTFGDVAGRTLSKLGGQRHRRNDHEEKPLDAAESLYAHRPSARSPRSRPLKFSICSRRLKRADGGRLQRACEERSAAFSDTAW